MVRMSLYRKLIARLLILVYLLVGIGISNNLLWCQEAGASAHIEYNPAGKCRVVQTNCLSADESCSSESPLSLSLILADPTANCFDTTTSPFHTLSLKSTDLLAPPQMADWPALQFVPRIDLASTSLTILNLAAQPPPSQAHIAQRTIVLLH